jgi:hypothetical protein
MADKEVVPVILVHEYPASNIYPYGEILREYQGGSTYRNNPMAIGARNNATTRRTLITLVEGTIMNSTIGRWLTPDPLADQYPGWSPYSYVLGNSTT